MTTVVSPSPFRILVVENDAQQRDDLVETLQGWGYETYVAEASNNAEDSHQALLRDAKDKAYGYCCHLAIVDMRLLDDSDATDTSGLRLVPELAPTVSIIFSGKGDGSTARAGLKTWGAYDFIGKGTGLDTLKQAIEEVEREKWGRDIEIVWLFEEQTGVLAGRSSPKDSSIASLETDDLLRSLFPKAQRLRIETTFSFAPRSLFLLVWQDSINNPVMVKVGKLTAIQREIEVDRKYIASSELERATLRITRHQLLWDVGGLVYDRLPREMKTFMSMFSGLDIAHIKSILRNVALLLKVWQHGQEPLEAPLVDEYLAGHEIPQEAQNDEAVPLPGYTLNLPAPVAWVFAHREQSRIAGTRQAIGHGSLLADNIFVDENNELWLIDFGRTGRGHTLRDFAALEIDILIRLMSDVEMSVYSELALTIAQTDRSCTSTTPRVHFNPQAGKALESVYELRRLAAEITLAYNPDEYLWALLLTTVRRLVDVTPAFPEYERARVLGSVLCYRIEQRQAAWPPARLGQIRWLTPGEMETYEVRAKTLRQKLALNESEKRGYEKNVPTELLQKIDRIRQELEQLGVNP